MSGAGRNLTIARQPVFQELPQGRVAFLTACPGIYCGPAAANDEGMRGTERPGVNPLGLTVWTTVTAAQFDQLKAIRDSILARRHEPDVLIPTDMPHDRAGHLTLLGERFVIGDKPGEFRYEINPERRAGANPGRAEREGARRLRHLYDAQPYESVRVPGLLARQLSGRFHATVHPQADRQRPGHVRRARQSHHAGDRNLQGPSNLLQSRESGRRQIWSGRLSTQPR